MKTRIQNINQCARTARCVLDCGALLAQSKTWRLLVATLLLSALNHLPAIAFVRVGLVAIALAAAGQLSTCLAQTTAFTYQGRLAENGIPANGFYDFEFRVHDLPVGGTQLGETFTRDDLGVTNGLFILLLNFGGAVFDGNDRYLDISVRPGASAGGYTSLSLRQRISSAPYAIRAATFTGPIGAGQLAGVYSNAVTFDNAGNSFAGGGAALTSLNASQLTTGTVPSAALGNTWQIGGNAGTSPGTHYLGTTDNRPLELRVNSQRVLRLEPTADAPNVIGGSPSNSVAAGVRGATIAGGGLPGSPNRIDGNFATIGGGTFHLAGGQGSTIAGGRDNQALGNQSTVGGGWLNHVLGAAESATIAGGVGNRVDSAFATVAGGSGNVIGADAGWSAIGGGLNNLITSNAVLATIAGGIDNVVGFDSDLSTIGGGGANVVAPGSWYSTISGGQLHNIGVNSHWSVIGGGYDNDIGDNSRDATIGGGTANRVDSAFATVAGGSGNVIGADAGWSTIGGGINNLITSNAVVVTIAGGVGNVVGFDSNLSTIGGGGANVVASNSWYSTISGGQFHNIGVNSDWSVIGGGAANQVGADAPYASILGGQSNSVGANSDWSLVVGGQQNSVGTNSDWSVVVGGQENGIALDSWHASIVGGYRNTIHPLTPYGVIGGGGNNTIVTNSGYATVAGGGRNRAGSAASTISGGFLNGISSNAWYAVIPGGNLNEVGVGATNAFAAGYRAKANHRGAFVWADSMEADFASTRSDQFNVRASGGARFVGPDNSGSVAALVVQGDGNQMLMDGNELDSSGNLFLNHNSGNHVLISHSNSRLGIGLGLNTPSHPIDHSSGAYLTAAGVWTSVSDRDAKEDFVDVDPQDVLAKVAVLPITQWRYKVERDGVKHLGPVAQDFHAAFGLGESDTAIGSVDADGVALAAIQGLNEKVEAGNERAEVRTRELEQRLEQKETEITELKARLTNLEKLITGSNSKVN